MNECSDTGERLTRLEARFDAYVPAHEKVHGLERRALDLKEEGSSHLQRNLLSLLAIIVSSGALIIALVKG